MNKLYYIFFLILISCSNTGHHRNNVEKLRTSIEKKDYEESLKIVNDKKFYSDKNSALLKYLEKATSQYLNQNYYQALKNFETAKKISDDLYTISIKNKILSGWDGNLDDYYGERYERSTIRFYISLINYLIYNQGFYEEYQDENKQKIEKKILTENEKNFHLSYSRTSIIEWDSLLQTFQNESFSESVFKNSILAKIWGSFIHSQFNTSTDKQIAIQLYKDANDLLLRNYNTYSIFNEKSKDFDKDFKNLYKLSYQELHKNYIQETDLSKDLSEYITRNRKNLEKNKKDNLVIILKDNLISAKKGKQYKIPFPITSFGSQQDDLYEFARLVLSQEENMPYILIEFPEIEEIIFNKKYKVVVYDKENQEVAWSNLTLIEPLSSISKKTLDDKIVKIKAEIIARIIAKYATAITTSYALYSQDSPIAKISALATFKSSSILINNTSKADLRYWSSLFSNLLMTGITLENGEYKINILLDNDIIFEKEININNNTVLIDVND